MDRIISPFDSLKAASIGQGWPHLPVLAVNPTFYSVVSKLPGWMDLLDARERLSRPVAPDLDRFDAMRAAVQLVDGRDPEEVVTDYLAAEAGNERARAREILTTEALRELSGRAEVFVSEHSAEISAGFSQLLNDARTQAVELRSEISGVYSSADLDQHPDAAEAWGRFLRIGTAFEKVVQTVRLWAPIDRFTWPGSEVIAVDDYERLWPGFFLGREGLTVTDGNGKRIRDIEQAEVPWNADRPTSLLRAVMETDVAFEATDRLGLERRQEAINELNRIRRDENSSPNGAEVRMELHY